ncbi:MAG: iron-sulfur cluster assembly scaffold protein [Sphingobium sp.]
MSAPLYNQDILRLATSIQHQGRLVDADASVELRSPTCGSRITVDVRVDDAGRLIDLGLEARACALGQASASLMAANAIGRSVHQTTEAAERLRAFLSNPDASADFWPGMEVLAPARAYPARHPSILLAFDAVATAMQQAVALRRRGAA